MTTGEEALGSLPHGRLYVDTATFVRENPEARAIPGYSQLPQELYGHPRGDRYRWEDPERGQISLWSLRHNYPAGEVYAVRMHPTLPTSWSDRVESNGPVLFLAAGVPDTQPVRDLLWEVELNQGMPDSLLHVAGKLAVLPRLMRS